MMATKLFKDFFNSEKAGGLVLVCCTIVSLCLVNSPWQTHYLKILDTQVAGHDAVHWINDGLMAIFFLLIGLELEREIYIGELSNLKQALLPVSAAIGGMLVPAGIYLFINHGLPSQPGAGIPMATDIAFALGILSLLGNRVSASLKIFLTALAVIDDLGAILVIALFYSTGFVLTNLLIALGIFAALLICNRMKVYNLLPYIIGGVAMWYFILHSGIHASIAGVLLAFTIPFGDGSENSASYKLQHFLHKPVAFIILPLFALGNTALIIDGNWQQALMQPLSAGIFAGLVAGKVVGIFLFSFLAVVLGICALPADIKWKHIAGTGFLGGIGFTMSIFISLLAFTDTEMINHAKLTVLISSLVAGLIGYVWLSVSLRKK